MGKGVDPPGTQIATGPFDRITLTIPALLNSDEVLFVIRGDDKRAVFDPALNSEHDLPIARFLAAANLPVTCFA